MFLKNRLCQFLFLLIISPLTLCVLDTTSSYGLDGEDERNPGTKPGLGRGECEKLSGDLPDFMPLVAVDTSLFQLVSTNAHPTFWVYSPYNIGQGTEIEFVIYNRSGDQPTIPTYEGSISNVEPGIIGISLPQSTPLLVEGNSYEWILRVRCDGNIVRASGYINIDLEMNSSNFAWYDKVTGLAIQLYANPSSISILNQWRDLLTQAGLSEIVGQSTIRCCQTPIAPESLETRSYNIMNVISYEKVDEKRNQEP